MGAGKLRAGYVGYRTFITNLIKKCNAVFFILTICTYICIYIYIYLNKGGRARPTAKRCLFNSFRAPLNKPVNI